MKRVVDAVQVIAALAAIAFVVLLFANEPDRRPTTPGASGATVYADRCAVCHGADGTGGVGPSLVGISERMPDIADEVAVVTDGRGTMPAWGGRLSAEEIDAVVAFTRSDL